MFIELHLIQSFAPANLNRDDTGTPKDCEFGGHRRARISSQCIKRAMRQHPIFHEHVATDIGQRTRWLTQPITEALVTAGKSQEEATLVARTIVAHTYVKSNKNKSKETTQQKMDKDKPDRTQVLLYVSQEEMKRLITATLDNWDTIYSEAVNDPKAPQTNKLAKQHLIDPTKGRTSAPDIALFGRMLADQPELNIDAACQMAHALSTHRVTMEMDYYTAVDDLLPEQEEGAGMVGFTGYNSACFYRYARLDWEQLARNLGGDREVARRTVAAFLRAAHAAVPSGKQAAFGAHCPAGFSLAVVRQDGMAWSLVNAFEKPVRAGRESGYSVPSIEVLDDYWGRLTRVYGDEGTTTAALLLEGGVTLTHLAAAVQPSLNEWIEATLRALPGG